MSILTQRKMVHERAVQSIQHMIRRLEVDI